MQLVAQGACLLAAISAAAQRPSHAQWTTPTNLSNSPNLFSVNISCDFDSDGRIHVVWEDFCDDIHRVYYATNEGERTGAPIHAIKTLGSDLHFFYSKTVDGFEDVFYMIKPRVNPNPPGPPTSFAAVPDENRAQLTWRNPPDEYYTGTMVRVSTSGCPGGPFDDDYVCFRNALPDTYDSYLAYPLTPGLTNYFSAFAQDAVGRWSAAGHDDSIQDHGLSHKPDRRRRCMRPGGVSRFQRLVQSHGTYPSLDLLLHSLCIRPRFELRKRR